MSNKILVVDDDKDVADCIRLTLAQEGYEVVTAGDGYEAMAQAMTQRPALILMDVIMPNMDGFEAARRLREDEAMADVPIVMLTVKDEDVDVYTGWEMGSDFYWKKPFEPVQLAAFVKQILQG